MLIFIPQLVAEFDLETTLIQIKSPIAATNCMLEYSAIQRK